MEEIFKFKCEFPKIENYDDLFRVWESKDYFGTNKVFYSQKGLDTSIEWLLKWMDAFLERVFEHHFPLEENLFYTFVSVGTEFIIKELKNTAGAYSVGIKFKIAKVFQEEVDAKPR